MPGFTYKLELEDGTPADPPTLESATSTWNPETSFRLGRDKALRVIGKRPADEPNGDPVLVVADG